MLECKGIPKKTLARFREYLPLLEKGATVEDLRKAGWPSTKSGIRQVVTGLWQRKLLTRQVAKGTGPGRRFRYTASKKLRALLADSDTVAGVSEPAQPLAEHIDAPAPSSVTLAELQAGFAANRFQSRAEHWKKAHDDAVGLLADVIHAMLPHVPAADRPGIVETLQLVQEI